MSEGTGTTPLEVLGCCMAISTLWLLPSKWLGLNKWKRVQGGFSAPCLGSSSVSHGLLCLSLLLPLRFTGSDKLNSRIYMKYQRLLLSLPSECKDKVLAEESATVLFRIENDFSGEKKKSKSLQQQRLKLTDVLGFLLHFRE